MKPSSRLQSAAYLAADAMAAPIHASKPHILLACMPKSASTFLATALSRVKGLRRRRLIPQGGGREQELCPIRLSRYNHTSYVSQQHTRHSAWTQQLINQYHLTPVVLVRDLADTAISLRDHFRREPTGQGPSARLLEHHKDLPDTALDDAIVRLVLPWYFNFYTSWRLAGNVPIYDYAQYTSKPTQVIAEILEHANCPMGTRQIQASLDQVNKEDIAQFNVGVPGRGGQLGADAKQQLIKMLDLYDTFQEDPLFIKTRQTIESDGTGGA